MWLDREIQGITLHLVKLNSTWKRTSLNPDSKHIQDQSLRPFQLLLDSMFCPPIHLFICPLSNSLCIRASTHLPISSSIHTSIHPTTHPYIYSSIHTYMHPSICPFIHPSTHLPVHPLVYLSTHASSIPHHSFIINTNFFFYLGLCICVLSVHPSTHPSTHIPTHLSICAFTHTPSHWLSCMPLASID